MNPENTLKQRKEINGNTLLLLITIVLFVVLYAGGCIAYSGKGFTNLQTFLNILISNAGLICVACGMTCVMLTGGIDISVGSLVALDCMLLAYGMGNWGIGAPAMCLIVLVVGLVFGFVQGFCVGYLQIQPFIVTMAGMFFARGMTAVISTDQLSITAETSQTFYDWANFRIYLPFGGVANRQGKIIMPYFRIGVVVAILILILIFLVLRYTKFGRSLYAVGCEKNQTESICPFFFLVFHWRDLLLPEYTVCQRSTSQRFGNGCNCVFGYWRDLAYRRCRQCNRFFLWGTDQRNDFQYCSDQW